MGKFDYRDLSAAKRRSLLDQLAEVIVAFRKKEEVRQFLERLLTPSEVVMLARRWRIAELLVGGRTYDQIQRKLGVGISTIQSYCGAQIFEAVGLGERPDEDGQQDEPRHGQHVRQRPQTTPGQHGTQGAPRAVRGQCREHSRTPDRRNPPFPRARCVP